MGWGRLTLYLGPMHIGGPIVIEKLLKVDSPASLFLLRPRSKLALYVDLHAHLRCRRNSTTDTQASVNIRNEGTKDVRARGWCPGSVIFLLQFDVLIINKQIQLIWDALQCNFWMSPKISGMDLN